MLARSSLALVVVLGVSGCATSNYRPANGPRVSIAADGLYKNGKKSNDLLVAVADNPRALEEARTAQSLLGWGRGLSLGAAGMFVAGLPTFVIGAKDHNDPALVGTGLGLVAGALVLVFVASTMNGNAGVHALDAINIYNDDVEAKMCLKHPVPSPTEAPPTPPSAPR